MARHSELTKENAKKQWMHYLKQSPKLVPAFKPGKELKEAVKQN